MRRMPATAGLLVLARSRDPAALAFSDALLPASADVEALCAHAETPQALCPDRALARAGGASCAADRGEPPSEHLRLGSSGYTPLALPSAVLRREHSRPVSPPAGPPRRA